MLLKHVVVSIASVIATSMLIPINTSSARSDPVEGQGEAARHTEPLVLLPSAAPEGVKPRSRACPTTIAINWPVGIDTTYTRLLGVEFGQGDDPETGPCEEILYDYGSFRLYINGQDHTSSVPYVNEYDAVGQTALLDQTVNAIRVTLDGVDVYGNSVTVEDFDTVYVNTTPKPIVDLSFNNSENQNRALCAANCFSVSQAVSSVPYFSLDEGRSVTVLYDGDRAHPRPFIYADVSIVPGSSAPEEFWLQAKVKWSTTFDDVTFTNGDAVVKFSGSSQARRLGAQIDATARATGVYPMQIVVSSKFPTATVSQIITTRLIVVNERLSSVARGWTIAGLSRVYSIGDSAALVTDGSGSATYYSSRSCGPTVCTYTSPTGEFAKLVDSATLSNKVYVRTYPDSSRVRFNHLGWMTSTSNRLGHTTSFEFDGSQRLVKVFDPYRKVTGTSNKAFTRLYYGTAGIDSIVSPGPSGSETAGRTTRFTVLAADSTLITARDPDGDSTRFAYDVSKRLATVTDRRGNAISLVYDAFWKPTRIDLPPVLVDAGGGTTQLDTLSIGLRPWQVRGVPSTSTSSSPATPIAADSMVARIISAAADTTVLWVNRWGMPTKEMDPLSGTTVITYLSTVPTLPIQVQAPDGRTTKYGYFTDRGLVATYQGPGQDSVLRFAYGAYAQVDSIWGFLRPHVRYFRTNTGTARGNVDSIRIDYDANRVTRFVYDSAGRIIAEVDPTGDSVQYHYDGVFGNADSLRTSSGAWTRILFDRFGRDSVSLGAERPTSTVLYDVTNRATHLYDSTGASPTVLGYDELLLDRIQDPVGQVYKYEHNALGWRTRAYDPADTVNRSVAYRYNLRGVLTSWTNRRGERVDQTFDKLGRLLSRSGTNVVADSFGYSSDRRRSVAWNEISRDSMFYSSDGWLDSVVTRIAGRRFRRFHAPDPLRRIDSVSVLGQLGGPSLTSRRAYWNPDLGTLDSLFVAGVPAGFRYDSEFRRDSTAWPSAIGGSEHYTSTGALYDELIASMSTGTLFHAGYGRDSLNRIVQSLEGGASSYDGEAFTYDDYGRLAKREFFSVGSLCGPTTDFGYVCSFTADSSESYRYDAVGNDTSGSSKTYSLGNRLNTWNGITFEHDLDGNRTRRCVGGSCATSDVRFEFSSTNRLRKVISGSDTTEYDYNALGELVRVRLNSTVQRHYLWENGQLLAELNGAGSQRVTQYVYGRGIDRPHAMVTGEASFVRFISQDALGNIDGIFAGATVFQRRAYDPWGKIAQVSGAMADTNRLGWKSLLYEGDSTRLYYMRNRWYDPETHRFVSEDPIGLGGGMNLYLFAGGEPINRWDPFGLADCPFEFDPSNPNCVKTILGGMTISGTDGWSIGPGIGLAGSTGGIGLGGAPAAGENGSRWTRDEDGVSDASGEDEKGPGPSNNDGESSILDDVLSCALQHFGVDDIWKLPVAALGLPVWGKPRLGGAFAGASDRWTGASAIAHSRFGQSLGLDRMFVPDALKGVSKTLLGSARVASVVGRASLITTIGFAAYDATKIGYCVYKKRR